VNIACVSGFQPRLTYWTTSSRLEAAPTKPDSEEGVKVGRATVLADWVEHLCLNQVGTVADLTLNLIFLNL